MNTTYKVLITLIVGMFILVGCQGRNGSITKATNESDTKATSNHFNTLIAEIVNNEIVFSQDIADIIHIWESVVNKSASTKLAYWTYSIKMDDDSYYLVGIDSITPAISKVCLILDNGKFYEELYPGPSANLRPSGTSVTCSGCTSTGSGSIVECEPKGNELTGWYCSDCSDGTCVKSVTNESGGILSL